MGFRIAQRSNGVAKLHGAVSRGMFQELYPGFDVPEVPIGSVTNGVHRRTWTSPPMDDLFKKALGDVDISSMGDRSEEHTSELQSRGHLVCRLLLEKKNTQHSHEVTPARQHMLAC